MKAIDCISDPSITMTSLLKPPIHPPHDYSQDSDSQPMQYGGSAAKSKET